MTSKLRRFIKVSDMIINTNMIKTISIHPTQYNIELSPNIASSSGFLIGGTGYIGDNNSPYKITIYKDKSPNDYDYLTNWIANEIDDAK